ncbi:hypothetical protein ACQKWADRAFT_299444 [Trichoderma austrokoningii]
MSKVIAVAGGTGSVGRTIVDELEKSPLYDTIILARNVPENSEIKSPVLAIDYNNIAEMAQLLASRKVEVVISTLHLMDNVASIAQINLIKAANQSGTVKRFIVSEWGIVHTEASPMYKFREDAASELRKSKLEWTRIANGYFMDYYGYPHVKTYLKPLSFVIDMANKAAGIPGTGDDIVAFTYTADVAKFVVASLGLPKWDEISYCYGEKSSYNKILALAEEARGTKFHVTYDPVEKLNKGEVTELPSHVAMYAIAPKEVFQGIFSLFGKWIIDGGFDVPEDISLNAKFPDIKTTKLSEVIGAWKGH